MFKQLKRKLCFLIIPSLNQQIFIACLIAIKAKYWITYFLIAQPQPSIKPQWFERLLLSSIPKDCSKMLLLWLVKNFSITGYIACVCYLWLCHYQYVVKHGNLMNIGSREHNHMINTVVICYRIFQSSHNFTLQKAPLFMKQSHSIG